MPYEEQLNQQWLELPLPDENLAWDDMRRRLEEKDDDRFFFWWRRGCLGWLLILLVAGGAAWYFLRTGEPKNKEQRNDEVKEKPVSKIEVHKEPKDKKQEYKMKEEVGSNRTIEQRNNEQGNDEMKEEEKKAEEKKVEEKKDEVRSDEIKKEEVIVDEVKKDEVKKPEEKKEEQKKEEEKVEQKKEEKKKEKARLEFSGGIGLIQQVPLAGQHWNPYNSSGRKNSLTDYIPLIYLQMGKPNKWFIQGAFRYGAPQYTKDLLYKQQIITDTFNPGVSTIYKSVLKKTFYHQVPLTFNYVYKNISVGAGVQWNKFTSAIAEKTVSKRNNQTQADSLISKLINKVSGDSALAAGFKKSYWNAIIQAQVHVKKFSFGVRYTFGLEPFILQERNKSLQVFLNYELWRSKKKK